VEVQQCTSTFFCRWKSAPQAAAIKTFQEFLWPQKAQSVDSSMYMVGNPGVAGFVPPDALIARRKRIIYRHSENDPRQDWQNDRPIREARPMTVPFTRWERIF
jgi:hypothetical protein